MIDTKALRSRVLDLAFQGKLTEQLESDGTAEELWQQIQAEKQRLIKEGKLKKEKPLPEITPNEIPFEIPENWKWVRMGAVYSFNPSVEADESIDAAFIPMDKISAGYNRDFSFEVQKWEAASKNHTRFSDGDVAFAKITPCFENRKSFVAEGLPNTIGGGTTELIILRQPFIYAYYTYLLIIQQRFIDAGVSTYKGTAGQQRVKNDALKQYLIPLPPLAEQKRIVARVEKIFRLLDIIDAAQERYAADAESLKAKLITLGIQGRLTEQLESDGTAEELYQQIQAEKQRLIQAGKIKKEKPLPEIKPEEVPFEIPENWKWCRLGELCDAVTGRLDANQQDPNGQYPFFTCGQEVYRINEYAFDCDAILLGGNNASGDYKMHRYNGKFNAYQRVYVITVPPHDTLDYLYYIIGYWLPHLKFNSQGAMTRFIRIGQVHNMLVPLPPLAEQKRIAETLERVLGVLA